MEYDQQLEFRDFIMSTLRVYVNDIGTEKDTEQSYFSVFKSIQDYKGKVTREDFKKFLSEIQNVLLFENENHYRKKAGEFLLAIIKSRSTIGFIMGRWNTYYLEIINDVKKNALHNNEMGNIEKSHIFYLYFDKKIYAFADVQKIVCTRDLLVGDILNFSRSKILENLEYIYKTPLFKIIKREYSVKFGEMSLHLVHYIE